MTEPAVLLEGALPGHRVVRELGGGGMSRVFLAEDLALGRPVVIKVLSGGAALNAGRFHQEILLSARLQHPNIVPVLSAGDLEGVPYFVMPLVEGHSLRALLREQGPMPVAEVTRYLRNVAAALACAHQRGIVHRDIKPDNVIVSGGVAVVLDFGVAKALAASTTVETDSNLTSSGLAVGTPAYMAPEQAVGDPDIDARADVYAFGVLAYELLTATTPFGGREPAQVLRAHLFEPPPEVKARRTGLPSSLASLVMRCLAKERGARPQSATELLDLLDAMVTPTGTRAAVSGRQSTVAAAGVPALIYGVACLGMFAGVQWLATEGQVGTRVVMLSAIGSFLGLPVVIAAGLLLQIRRSGA